MSVLEARMAGVKQFDRKAVLDRAALAFWRSGYEATSIQDLESATGLGRGSLYNAFGDKQALFLEVLERYAATEAAAALCALDDPDAYTGLSRTLRSHVARMHNPDRPRGCLFTNTCAGARGDPVDAFISQGVRTMEFGFEAAFIRARNAGQLDPSADPRRLARFYCAVMQGIAVLHRASADRQTLEDVIEGALAAWPAGCTDLGS